MKLSKKSRADREKRISYLDSCCPNITKFRSKIPGTIFFCFVDQCNVYVKIISRRLGFNSLKERSDLCGHVLTIIHRIFQNWLEWAYLHIYDLFLKWHIQTIGCKCSTFFAERFKANILVAGYTSLILLLVITLGLRGQNYENKINSNNRILYAQWNWFSGRN